MIDSMVEHDLAELRAERPEPSPWVGSDAGNWHLL